MFIFARGNDLNKERFHGLIFKMERMHTNDETYKETLLAGISGLFLKYGLRSTSMDDMASHLNISKKTLYQYFTNKDDVVEQVMVYRHELLRHH